MSFKHRLATWWSNVPQSSFLKSLYYWYWGHYYAYGKLYAFWQYLFPVTGRAKNMYMGDERLFRPLKTVWRAWHRLLLAKSTYRMARKYRAMERAKAFEMAITRWKGWAK